MKPIALGLAVLAMAPSATSAALLSVNTLPDPVIVGEMADIGWDPDFDEFFSIGYATGELVSGGSTVLTDIFTLINAEIGAGGAIGPSGGAGLVDDGASFFGSGTLLDFGFAFGPGDDVLQFLFEADGLGFRALATLTGEFGDTPFFDRPDDFEAYGADVKVEVVAPVPVPAGGLLLLTALGGLALRGTR